MQIVPKNQSNTIGAKRIVHQARTGLWNGMDWTSYFMNCSWWLENDNMSMILTRDHMHHESGWWKNPDYERCWHLSMAFYHPDKSRKNKDIKLTEKWLDLIYRKNKTYVWSEPPWSDSGKRNDSWHYRVFVDENWQPIIPRGEVYTKKFTEPGWLSYSELQAYHKNT